MKPYKSQKVQLLTEENKRVRLQRCRLLQQRAAGTRWERILFTDEKLFSVEQAHNRQNDRYWSSQSPGSSAIVEHRQNPQSVMVWGGICSSVKTPLVFVEQGVKINQKMYGKDILETVVLPWAHQHFGIPNGPSSKTRHQPIGRKPHRSGVGTIFRLSSQHKNGRHTHQISIQWITVCGQFWRPGLVIIATKVWSL